MGSLDNLENNIRRNRKNVSFDDLKTLMESYGFVYRQGKGSHRIVKHPDLRGANFRQTSVPFARPVLKCYVDNCLNLLDWYLSCRNEEDEH